MINKLISAASVVTAAAPSKSEHWAVLVAGSHGYGNYRHHADICHAYHIMRNNGIPEDQIIVMAYDDVANSRENPFPGQLFNKPTPKGTPGVDVYKGCKIDYKGKQNNRANLLKVLKGDASAGGRVLKTTKDSKVFFNFVDHGGPQTVEMPDGLLHAD
jgi:legumain